LEEAAFAPDSPFLFTMCAFFFFDAVGFFGAMTTTAGKDDPEDCGSGWVVCLADAGDPGSAEASCAIA
jgi:hypothetical protein